MTRYKATIAYDGTDFAGFQSKTNHRIVQKEIEQILTNLNSFEQVILQGSAEPILDFMLFVQFFLLL